MKISISYDNTHTKEVDLYSDDGMRLITDLWIKASFQHRVMYEPTWLGIPIIQYPNDIVMMQELIWKLRPDVIIETGIGHGGSTIFYSSLLELLGKGAVIGVDIEIRKHNKLAIKSHPLSKRIKLIEGSSVSREVINQIRNMIPANSEVLVILDSNHSYQHVLMELSLYKDFISPGGYLVVMDGVQEMLGDTPSGKPEWKEDNPLAAIREFLSNNLDWQEDGYYLRTYISCNPSGFLRRKRKEEINPRQ